MADQILTPGHDGFKAHRRGKYQRVFERDHHTCQYCFIVCANEPATSRATIDHRIPKVRGGDSSEANLITACKSCNSQKRDKTDAEYREWRLDQWDWEETRL